MKRTNRRLVLLLWAALTLLTTDALAILKDLGSINPVNGYPVWYRDLSANVSANGQNFPQGLPLELCESQAANINGYLCNLLPEDADPANGAPGFIPEQPRDFETNFPSESFWFSADSILEPASGDFSSAGLTIGLEAAFAGLAVQQGDQVSFARIRVRVDVNTPGTYRITHPYGVLVFPDVAAGVKAINFTEDVGIGAAGNFNGALAGKIGPFLTWDTDFPIVIGSEVFIGDPAIAHTVTGSPFGTNYFRVERINGQGDTLSIEETANFNITGKIYTTPIASPLKATRASYARNATSSSLFVFAEADVESNVPPSLSTLQVSAPGITPTLMTTDGNGNFFVQILTVPELLPASVTITNLADIPPTSVEVAVVDEVTITSAVYDQATEQLQLAASSSDLLSLPFLTSDYGDLLDGQLIISTLAMPSATVEIRSSAGGTDRELVTVTVPQLVENVQGIGIFRQGQWLLNSGNIIYESFGQAGDLPVIGDWSGSGTDQIGVFRHGAWFLDANGNGAWDPLDDTVYASFGQSGDLAVTGDWSGGGTDQIGVFRNGAWFLDANGNGTWDPLDDTVYASFGQAGDLPVIGDWDGDGIDQIGVFRNGAWFLDANGNGAWDPDSDTIYPFFGLSEDLPIVGDWNGSSHIGVYRNGIWYLDANGNGAYEPGLDIVTSFGESSDLPISGGW